MGSLPATEPQLEGFATVLISLSPWMGWRACCLGGNGVFGRWRGGEGLAYKTQTTAGLSFCVVAMVMAMVVTG